MSRTSHILAVVLLATIALGASACGRHETVVSTATNDPRAVPGLVAVAQEYLDDLDHGDLEAVRALMAPGSLEAFDAISPEMETPKAVFTDTRIGGVDVVDDHATVVFLGTVCPTDAGHQDECVTNDDPNSAEPGFSIRLVLVEGEWKVAFDIPSGAPSSPASEEVPNADSGGDVTSGEVSSDDGNTDSGWSSSTGE